jgi:lipoprotein-anchoring transpeptidase ErfK/SrfK
MTPKEEDEHQKDGWLGKIASALDLKAHEAAEPVTTSEKAPTDLPPLPQASKRSRKFYSLAIAFTLLAVLGLAVLSALSLAKLSIGGKLVSANIADNQLKTDINEQAASYRLAVAYPNGSTKTYPLAAAGLNLNTNASLSAINTNPIAVNNFIDSSINVTVQPSVDANLSINGGNIQLSNAASGLRYGLSNPGGQIMSAAATLSSTPLKLQTLAINPALTTEALMPYKAQLQKILTQSASFTIAGQSVTPTQADIASWLEITPNDKNKSLDISVNSGKVQAYINNIATGYIRPAKAQVEVQQSDGSTQVLVPGENGIAISNESSISSDLAKSLMSAKGFSYPLPVSYAPFTTITAGDYPKWIEVDLTHYRLYAYENANLVNTFLISAGRPSTPTPTGQFAIQSKFVQQDMYGQNVDGSSYFQPNVPWINYFAPGGFAIHGNYWRPTSYFGSVNSSHGCVGLMVSDAEWVYNWAPVGTPIIIHN